MRALLVLAILLASRPADACKVAYYSVFRHFDDAAVVAHGRVRAPGGKLALAVIDVFKGTPKKLVPLAGGPRDNACAPKLRGNGIIFLSAEGGFVAAYDSFPAATKELLVAIRAYAAAKTPAERAAVLVEQAVTNLGTRLAFDASLALADDPAALGAITPADRDRLIAVLPNVRPDSFIPFVLARIGVPADKLDDRAAAIAAEHKFEAITKPGDLADILAAIPISESPRAAAAFERCERLHGKRLHDIRHVTQSSLDWTVLATSCRTGVATSP